MRVKESDIRIYLYVVYLHACTFYACTKRLNFYGCDSIICNSNEGEADALDA